MNTKKRFWLFFATFITIFATDFIIHGMLMKSTYQATAQLWRPEAEMSTFMPYMFFGQAMIAFFFSWIFAHGYKGGGWQEGVRYGLFFTGYTVGTNFVMYAVAPYDLTLVMQWIAFGGIQAIITGVVCAKVCGNTEVISKHTGYRHAA